MGFTEWILWLAICWFGVGIILSMHFSMSYRELQDEMEHHETSWSEALAAAEKLDACDKLGKRWEIAFWLLVWPPTVRQLPKGVL